MNTPKNSYSKIATYLALTFGLSSIFYYLIISAGSLNVKGGMYVIGLMWCPGISAIITKLIFQKNLKGLGWKWGKTKYQLTAYFLPILYAFIAYGLIWITGLGKYNGYIPSNLFNFLVMGTLMSCFTALGEEIGWRGFLVPELAKVTSYTKLSLISGIIWSVYHYPVLLFADYNSGTPWWFGLGCFTLMAIGASFIFAWLRLRSGSVWTAMFLHASHNLYIQSYFDQATDDTGITAYISSEFGIALALVISLVAFLFWRKRSELAISG